MKLAFDRKTVRTIDTFGKMHVELSNISKAAVNPYYGREIPNGEALGLDDSKVYKLLRCPKELELAAATFNNLPLLSKHVPVTVDKPEQSLVVGSTGTDAVFEEPYLRNSLVVWEALAVAGINTDQKRQLSSAYSYEADMTPGTYCGVKYDGVMRNIKGNHVALVEEGRAGPDVIVGDSKLLEKPKMKKLSAKAVMVLGALTAYAQTVIAQDAQIGDLRTVVDGAGSLKTEKERNSVVAAFTKITAGKLAQDADLDALAPLVDSVAAAPAPDLVAPVAAPAPDMGAQLAALLGQMGLSPDIIAQIQAMCAGTTAMDGDDEDDKKKDEKVDKPAMDAAIAAATSATVARLHAVRAAEIDVQPVIGTLTCAMDSAPDVYKLALDHLKVNLDGVEPSAFKSVFKALQAQRAIASPAPRALAQDAAVSGASGFATMFPNAAKINGGA